MHNFNVLISGPATFLSTLNEVKPYLKFNLSINENNLSDKSLNNYHVFICNQEYYDNKNNQNILNESECIKILFTTKYVKSNHNFNEIIRLPTTIKEINNIIENSIAKKTFNTNSSIKIKNYLLDKNEKKLIKKNNHIILTEKEIQLLDLFLNNKKPIPKNKILSLVWHYSTDADTHTVETHIYRLRKKINEKFLDEKFILNNKEGYFL